MQKDTRTMNGTELTPRRIARRCASKRAGLDTVSERRCVSSCRGVSQQGRAFSESQCARAGRARKVGPLQRRVRRCAASMLRPTDEREDRQRRPRAARPAPRRKRGAAGRGEADGLVELCAPEPPRRTRTLQACWRQCHPLHEDLTFEDNLNYVASSDAAGMSCPTVALVSTTIPPVQECCQSLLREQTYRCGNVAERSTAWSRVAFPREASSRSLKACCRSWQRQASLK